MTYRATPMRGRVLVMVVVAAVATMVLGGCALPGLIPELPASGNRIVITKADRPQASDLRDADAAALRDPTRAPDVTRVTPVLTGTASVATQQTVRAPILGSTPEYLAATNSKLAIGTTFTDRVERVAVVGPGLVTSLFGGDTRAAVGGTMRVGGKLTFRIIGVLEHTGQHDDAVIMSLNAARAYLFGLGDNLDAIIVESTNTSTVKSALNQVCAVLDTQRLIREPSARDYAAVIE